MISALAPSHATPKPDNRANAIMTLSRKKVASDPRSSSARPLKFATTTATISTISAAAVTMITLNETTPGASAPDETPKAQSNEGEVDRPYDWAEQNVKERARQWLMRSVLGVAAVHRFTR